MAVNNLADRCNWSLLRIFCAIVQEGSLNRAAIRLNLTQSAVSQNLKKLEEQLDEQLLVRGKNGLRLTNAGQLIFESASRIYAELAGLGEQIRQQHSETRGTIKLLVLSRIQSRRFDQLLYDFHCQYPLTDFQIDVMRSSEIHKLLLQKVPALGICLSERRYAKLEYRQMIAQKYALFCGRRHPLFSADVGDVDDIRNQGLVLFQSDQLEHLQSPLTEFGENILRHNHILASTNNLDEMMRLIKAGIGIGCLPKHIVDATGNPDYFRQLPPFPHICTIPIYLVWHQDRVFTPLEQYLIYALQQRFCNDDQ